MLTNPALTRTRQPRVVGSTTDNATGSFDLILRCIQCRADAVNELVFDMPGWVQVDRLPTRPRPIPPQHLSATPPKRVCTSAWCCHTTPTTRSRAVCRGDAGGHAPGRALHALHRHLQVRPCHPDRQRRSHLRRGMGGRGRRRHARLHPLRLALHRRALGGTRRRRHHSTTTQRPTNTILPPPNAAPHSTTRIPSTTRA